MGIGLDSALSGLRTAQQQLNIISNNVSNVSTPGYTRKILPQSSQAINGVTVGVLTGTFTRNVDLDLQQDLWTQVSAVEEFDVQESYLRRIEQFHGDPALETSLAAELSALRDSFSALSDSPTDSQLLSQTVSQAQKTAGKINDFSDLILQLRNDAQSELQQSVTRANQLLQQIADLNKEISGNSNVERPTATLEDQRDEAVKELSGLMEISTFKRGDGVLVVQTNKGVQLADKRAESLTFRPKPLSASTYYPDSVAGLFVGDPITEPLTAEDIADDSIGGKMGGLLDLRDSIFPKQMAQLDELAHKLALRFEAQGLELFVNSAGTIPADTPPDPTTTPPTPVSYVGLSGAITVNQAVLNDHTLLQSGTFGGTINTGSNEVIRRVLEFTFGEVEFQEAHNSDTATGVDLLNTGGNDLQTWLGLLSSNTVTGSLDLTAYPDIATLVSSAGGALDDPNDQFEITFTDSRTGAPDAVVTIDLSTVPGGGGNAAQDIVNEINNQLGALPPATALSASASVGPNGEIVLSGQRHIQIDGSIANGMGQAGLNFLGLTEDTFNTTDPYFDVQVGNNDPVRIDLEPGDTSTELLAKLNAVPSLVAQLDANNFLQVRPGDDPTFNDQSFGGDLKLVSGPFTTDSAAYTGVLPNRTTIDDGVNIISGLFGTYQINGGVVENQSPVTDNTYSSQISASNTSTLAFRENLLGPGANISTEITGVTTLRDYARKIVNQHSLELSNIEQSKGDEESLKTVLEEQLLNESAVNLDEEMANLITQQTAFSASVRVVNAVDELFRELVRSL